MSDTVKAKIRNRIQTCRHAKLAVTFVLCLLAGNSAAAGADDDTVDSAARKPVLLREADFKYEGAFRLPEGTFGSSRFAFGGGALAHNPGELTDKSDDTLFISGHVHSPWMVAEISIPDPTNSNNLKDLKTAKVLQNFADVTDGKKEQLKPYVGAALGGLLVDNDRLLWTAYDNYDADYSADRSHGTSSLNLSLTDDAKGMYRVGALNPGFVGGYMTHVPPSWRNAFGCSVLTGLSNVAIITRTSSGPVAVGFNPSDLGVRDPVPAFPFVAYENGHALGGDMNSMNSLFNFNSTIGGMVFPEGTRSIVFFGSHGKGEVCYGTDKECEDPVRGGKGFHDRGGNYVYQAWAYDANDLLAVKNRRKRPSDVQPYAVWEPEFPFKVKDPRIGDVAYDMHTRRVFMVQIQADDSNPYENKPLIHVFKVAAGQKDAENGLSDAAEVDSAQPAEVETNTTPRRFTDASGSFSLLAEFVEFTDGKARLRKEDGTDIAISMRLLSEADQTWIREELKRRKQAASGDSDGAGSSVDQ